METIILFAPLVGALIAGFTWRAIGETAAQWISTGLLMLSALLSWIVFLSFDGTTETIEILRWVQSGTLDTSWAIRMDRLTAIMLIVITTVSALVHLYSFGYMAHDDNFGEGEHYKARFFAYLSFFTFAMLMLVTADNLVQMFFGWEGVGLASYLLIGFYYKKPSANIAAMKAFVVNRVGDFGFALGIFALFFLADSIKFDDIFAMAPEIAETQITFLGGMFNAAELVAVLLFIGAMGKSAQLILHTWLPDAMEGPTPVSALIHAATMVTAGVFLVCRMSPIMEFAPGAMTFVVILGATTAFFAATVGLVQNDIKRVIAYSTCSQLGYMFVAAGVGVYSVAMFHLLTHAFFKAMLFLGAGSVIHGMHHEQDMRNYGGLRHKLPYTFWAMMIGTLAITGVGIPLLYLGFPVGFAGFVSKDAIIESAFAANAGYAFWLLIIAAAMTSFYSWRLMFMTFYGKPRGDKHTHEHAHESPTSMLAPLAVLAVGAVLAGMVFYKPFFGNAKYVGQFFGVSYAEAGHHEEAHGDEHAAADDDADAAMGLDALVQQIITVKSGGNAEARNPLTTAEGPAGIIESTWLRLIQEERPDLAESLSREEILDLRRDPELAGQMTASLLEDAEAALAEAGHEASPGRLYLAFEFGPAAVNSLLAAAPDDAVADVLAEGVVTANPFLRDWTVARAEEWADRKMAPMELVTQDDHDVVEVAGEGGDTDHGETHYVFAGVPGEGAIYVAPENTVLDDAHLVPNWVKVAPFIAMLLGFGLAYQMYIRRPDLPGKLAENQRPLYEFLLNKWYFDEIYDAVFVKPAVGLGRLLWRRGDGNVIDGSINGVAMGIVPFFTRLAGRMQSGYVFTYALAMVLGIAVLLTWITIGGGAE